MSTKQTLAQRWENYRPSKALWFWSLAGAVAITTIGGFTVGGWTTSGNASTMAAQAARDARAELVAGVCVQKFAQEINAAEKLAELKEASSWQRDDYIEDGGWALLVGMEKAVPGAADACAEKLFAMENLPVRDVSADPATSDS